MLCIVDHTSAWGLTLDTVLKDHSKYGLAGGNGGGNNGDYMWFLRLAVYKAQHTLPWPCLSGSCSTDPEERLQRE